MPAVSKKQFRFFKAMENQQKKTGTNKTKMSMGKLDEFTEGVSPKGLPESKGKAKGVNNG